MTDQPALPAPPPLHRIAGVILAGGLSRRMGGGDKTLLTLDGKPMLAHVIERLTPQVGPMALNANGDPARFEPFGLPVLPDVVEGFAGPLAGVLTALRWAALEHPDVTHVLTTAADAPFVPLDLVARLWRAVEDGADIACAASGGWTHPVVALWPVRLAGDLRRALVDEDMRKIDAWTARYRTVAVEWPAQPLDPFFNVNRPEDLDAANAMLEAAEARAAVGEVEKSRRLSIVLERRTSSHPWGSDSYVPVAAVPAAADAPAEIRPAEADRWISAPMTVELFRRETEGYRRNLSAPEPRLYVILRPVEGQPIPMAPFLVTACPYEGEAYLHDDGTQLETVPMPEDVAYWVGAFCARHHVDTPFVKRKQKTKAPREDDTFSRIAPVDRARRKGETR
ncbi:molybdenum cofactor guanylyltransferase MobA [Caenispirillum bisanense]|uniref:Molybdenum cofactor guanylyltransferase n=1 Tax=Caenispirillum bisanense TaxID=414052 RepID=A0A286G5S6_9PROT|nr:molybdenum cofactor guanylyltransferase MobA [Caenispirillum bisanense]SOD90907.1 molybdopterin-guanine dinucleotide biosynthesis protein A [Caenispirillum bisanense]